MVRRPLRMWADLDVRDVPDAIGMPTNVLHMAW